MGNIIQRSMSRIIPQRIQIATRLNFRRGYTILYSIFCNTSFLICWITGHQIVIIFLIITNIVATLTQGILSVILFCVHWNLKINTYFHNSKLSLFIHPFNPYEYNIIKATIWQIKALYIVIRSYRDSHIVIRRWAI